MPLSFVIVVCRCHLSLPLSLSFVVVVVVVICPCRCRLPLSFVVVVVVVHCRCHHHHLSPRAPLVCRATCPTLPHSETRSCRSLGCKYSPGPPPPWRQRQNWPGACPQQPASCGCDCVERGWNDLLATICHGCASRWCSGAAVCCLCSCCGRVASGCSRG